LNQLEYTFPPYPRSTCRLPHDPGLEESANRPHLPLFSMTCTIPPIPPPFTVRDPIAPTD
jgi:hypothetical protein